MKKDYKLKDAQVIQYIKDSDLVLGFNEYAKSNRWRMNMSLQMLKTFAQPSSPRLMYLYAE